MPRIFYSVAGEGRGHATRVRTLVERLRESCEIVLYASGDAYDLLTRAYHESDVLVRPIPGLRFRYDRRGRLSSLRTGVAAAKYLAALPSVAARLKVQMEREEPDLVITDFEPALPRAAQGLDIPFVSLDHQHFLVVSDFSDLPRPIRRRVPMMRAVVSAYYRGQADTIVSSFFHPPARTGYEDSTRIGVLLRPEVLEAVPSCNGYLVAYLRRTVSNDVLDALDGAGMPVRVYGLGDPPPRGNLSFHPIHEQRFVEDLAGCEALISTAGNQLVGEALYLRKPVLAMPEPGNHEQTIHAHYLARSGAGDQAEMDRLAPGRVRSFVNRIGELRERIDPARIVGNDAAIAAVHRRLPPAWKPDLDAPRTAAPTMGGRS